MVKRAETLGSLIDNLYKAREAQRIKNHEADELKSAAYQLEKQLLEQFDRATLTGASGKVATLTVKTVVEPTINDFVTIFKYAARTQNYGLIQRRLNSAAVRELWDESKKVPGVGKFDRDKVSVRKLK